MHFRHALVFLAGAVAAVVVWSFIAPARAADPATYTCTAVKIPITKGKKADDPEAVVEQVLPAGYVPYGGGSGGYSYQGTGGFALCHCVPNQLEAICPPACSGVCR